MPHLYLSQSEIQRLEAIIKDDLKYLNESIEHERDFVRAIARQASEFEWDYETKKYFQSHGHSEINKLNKQIAKRVALLKTIKRQSKWRIWNDCDTGAKVFEQMVDIIIARESYADDLPESEYWDSSHEWDSSHKWEPSDEWQDSGC